jgi:phosphoglycolate phosphatase-like HAD superfamily hydrolase
MLHKLKELPVKIALVTNRCLSVLKVHLEAVKLAGFFDYVFTPDCFGKPKPAPDGVFYAMKEMHLTDPTKILLVGDDSPDLLCGNASAFFPYLSLII